MTERRPSVSPQVAQLIERIRGLVAERRRLERGGGSGRRERVRVEIARLQERLADTVRRELSDPGASRSH
jgi:hypothetical protein